MAKSTADVRRRTHAKLAGSARRRPEGATRARAGSPTAPLELTLRLRPGALDLARVLDEVIDGRGAHLTRQGFAARFGAAAADIAGVRRWARRARVTVTSVEPARRAVHVRAPAGRLARLFRVARVRYRRGAHAWNSIDGAVHVPAELAGIVTSVMGFDHERFATRAAQAAAAGSAGPRQSFTPPEVARLYRFPRNADGHGQTIGVIALGGGFRRSDMQEFFRSLGLPRPAISAVSVCGARNDPGDPAAGEITGDVQTAGALAPRAHIVVYFAPNTERGFLEAVSRAVHDRRHAPSVITISWGRNEVHWTRHVLRQFNEVLSEAALVGVSVCCSSGDTGALADRFDRRPHVCFPASSPYAIACGGTSLAGTRGTRIVERPWANQEGAGGSGTSVLLPRPAWQHGVAHATRGAARDRRLIPDVAANADPESGYRVFFRGQWVVGAGTSAAAPLWAGLIALINQRRGAPVGLITPFLYTNVRKLAAAGAMRPIPSSPRGRASTAWHTHTGLGAPHGARLVAALRRAASETISASRDRPSARRARPAR